MNAHRNSRNQIPLSIRMYLWSSNNDKKPKMLHLQSRASNSKAFSDNDIQIHRLEEQLRQVSSSSEASIHLPAGDNLKFYRPRRSIKFYWLSLSLRDLAPNGCLLTPWFFVHERFLLLR